jgi:hypothetical protein
VKSASVSEILDFSDNDMIFLDWFIVKLGV